MRPSIGMTHGYTSRLANIYVPNQGFPLTAPAGPHLRDGVRYPNRSRASSARCVPLSVRPCRLMAGGHDV
jgi:hypothetical protein